MIRTVSCQIPIVRPRRVAQRSKKVRGPQTQRHIVGVLEVGVAEQTSAAVGRTGLVAQFEPLESDDGAAPPRQGAQGE